VACDDVYRKGWVEMVRRLLEMPADPWQVPPAPTPLADLAAVRDATAEHGRPFGPPPPAEGDTPC
jgi:hypothetical protein